MASVEEYIFYTTNESFDYGCGTCYEHTKHGFSIEKDDYNNFNIDTLKGFNDFRDVENCETLEQLADYISFNSKYVVEDEYDKFNSNFRKLKRLYKQLVLQIKSKVTVINNKDERIAV